MIAVWEQRLNSTYISIKFMSIHHPVLLFQLVLCYDRNDRVIIRYIDIAQKVFFIYVFHLETQCVYMVQMFIKIEETNYAFVASQNEPLFRLGRLNRIELDLVVLILALNSLTIVFVYVFLAFLLLAAKDHKIIIILFSLIQLIDLDF